MTSIAFEPPRPEKLPAAQHAPRPGWLRGLIVTILLILGLEVVARTAYPIPTFGAILILAVVYAAIVGGLVPAVASAALCLVYSAYHLAEPGTLRFTPESQSRLLTMAIALPLAGVMVGVLRRRADSASRAAIIREREAANSELSASKEFNRAVLNSLGAHIAVLDAHGRIVAVNQAWEAFASANSPSPGAAGGNGGAGRAGAALGATGVGSNYLDVCRISHPGTDTHEDGADGARRAFDGITAVMRRQQDRFTMEYPCHSPEQQRWFLLTVTPLLSDHVAHRSDGARGVVVSHLDITDRKRIEQRSTQLLHQIDAHRGRMKQLLANVPGVVFETYVRPDEPAGRINYVSDYLERMMGYPVSRWHEQPDFLLATVHDDDRERVRGELAAVIERGGQRSCEFRWIARDGKLCWVEANCTAIVDPSGESVGIRGVITDIGRLKRAHQALRRRAAAMVRVARQLKRSNEELDQFAYITSHDLRAPLRGIANLSRWIEEDMGDAFPSEAHKQMELLRGRVHRMEALIDGILQYSRIDRVQVSAERVDVGKLVHEIVDLLAPPQGMRVEIPLDLPVLFTQRLRLQQVFMNLIGNAIKHHDRPHAARISIGCRDLGERWEFAVCDDGPGIAPQYHGKIFVIFQTLEARDKVEGTGVGLSLVKKIVEHHGGTVRVRSQPGHGAAFAFTWPKNPTSPHGATSS